MVFIKASREIGVNLDFIIRNGIAALLEGMQKFKNRPFDPDNPYPSYNDKNEYFNIANNICIFSLWQQGFHDLSERYYDAMLKTIREFEKNNSANFNKGMVYANLGVAQVVQGKIDDGFANLLKAHMEDYPYHKTDASKSVFNLKLYTQFEDKIKDCMVQHSKLYQVEEKTTVDKPYLDGLVSSLDTDSRILLITLVEKVRKYLEILGDKDNRFTRLQIFLSLQDLCLSVENALKTKNTIAGTLKPLLDNLFSTGSGRSRAWKPDFDSNYNLTTSNNVSELETNLKSIASIRDNNVRRLLICCTIRNFSSHNLDVGNNYVFSQIEIIFDNVLSSIFFLHDSGCL